ncbi:MAG TPA: DUF480 domain-containing protein [Steroidobacteraceae bacterium]|nr:DUF480 domain-containing protein [Steroidobacteraceae bacterium]
MPPQLSAIEVRVIACLLEKQVTTPEQYPLSLNALQNACNQKSNREPVMELSEGEVQATLDSLSKRHLVLERSGFGSRVPKYQQRLCNTEFSSLQLSAQERAVLCELMLRGPQTAGELRARAARMAGFTDAAEVESALEALRQRTDGALVSRLAREPGRREVRYMHLLGPAGEPVSEQPRETPGPPEPSAPPEIAAAPPPRSAAGEAAALSLESRVSALERSVARLSAELEGLRRPR